jgi:hypothetical protein
VVVPEKELKIHESIENAKTLLRRGSQLFGK